MIIRDFTDNDLYKFSVMNAIQKKFPDAEVVYRFVNRGETPFPEGFGEALRREVDAMRTLFLTDTAEAFMRRRCYYFDNVFFDLLKGFRFNPAEVTVVQEGGRLEVEVRGLWYRTVLWEVPLMAMISELYYRMTGATPAADADDRARAKARRFEELGAELSEFGTRRRFSFEVQDRVIGILKECMPRVLNGTSNVYRVANEMAMENWVDVYDGYLGIALPDTFTSTDFFKSFSTKYAKLFDGLRCDSGDPFEFTERALSYYERHRIDPKKKTVVYSDSLDLEAIARIKGHVAGRLHDVYGVGTFLTNDVGVQPLNIVIKLFEVKPKGETDFLPVVKLSDSPGKHTGDPDEIDLCKRMLKL